MCHWVVYWILTGDVSPATLQEMLSQVYLGRGTAQADLWRCAVQCIYGT